MASATGSSSMNDRMMVRIGGDNVLDRLMPKAQTLDEMYDPPANFLEVQVWKPMTHTNESGKKLYTDYEVSLRTNLPIFRLRESRVRRRYSDFEWLRNEVRRTIHIYVPDLPDKALARALMGKKDPDKGIFAQDFIEERRKGLEEFINSVAGHPLVQNERCLHAFLQEQDLDKVNFAPGKIPPRD